ncbi:MBL fold metallo-hydrolase [Patescibacteria group bacterium]|nr:MBL fold metallo-hydrolase [Patescibacteria group bacterium]
MTFEKMLQKIKNKIHYLILAALLAATIFVWQVVFAQRVDDKIKIDFFDVGQGSAILIDAPNNNQVLIDGGPSDAILNKLGSALPFSDRQIELVILTHPDSDHLSGLIEVLKRYEVGQILETGIADSSSEYAAWHALIAEKNIPLVFARAGQTIKIADNLMIKILYPFDKIDGQDFKNTNSTSIVSKFFYGKNTLLFTGDAEGATENPLLFAGVDLRADILQVAHHGSKNSTSNEFLAAVEPQIAVIQAGAKNKYGHPAQELLDRLKGVEIFRTDQDGDINFLCDLENCVKK